MSLTELLKKHGQAARFKHHGITNGVPIVVVAEDNGYFFVKFDNDQYGTITPKEAESGWTYHLRDIPVRSCKWMFMHSSVDIPMQGVYLRENVNPWDCQHLKHHWAYCDEMTDLKNWHRCDDEDVVLKETK